MNNDDMLRKIVMDHYKYPHNKLDDGVELENFIYEHGNNPSCGDDVEIYVSIDEDVIKEIYYKGTGCSICCASASILTEEIKGLTMKEAEDKIINFEKMLTAQEYDENIFEDAIVFSGIKDFPARFKCASISWITLQSILKGVRDEG